MEKLIKPILQKFDEIGLLKELVIAGSIAQYAYRENYNTDDINVVTTSDIDFAIPQPAKFSKEYNVPNIMEELGYEPDFDRVTGLIKYSNEDFEVEFLTSNSRKAKDGVLDIPSLKTNAHILPYLNLLYSYKIPVDIFDLTLFVPHPAAYVLHKAIINHLRKNPDKKEKDANAVREVGNFIISVQALKNKFDIIYGEIPDSWCKLAVKNLVKIDSVLLDKLITFDIENKYEKLYTLIAQKFEVTYPEGFIKNELELLKTGDSNYTNFEKNIITRVYKAQTKRNLNKIEFQKHFPQLMDCEEKVEILYQLIRNR